MPRSPALADQWQAAVDYAAAHEVWILDLAGRWNWGAGSSWCDGAPVGLQVGGQWAVGTGQTEDTTIIDGSLHKINDELAWDFNRSDPTAPSRARRGGPVGWAGDVHNRW